ncbi:MAG: pilin [Pseudomonadota bacterium]|nr:pilin [Pseudomonadota bacterium]
MHIQKGFTFIELMFVALVTSILAAVAIPAYTDYLERSKVVEAMLLSITVKQAIIDYYAYHGKFPANNQAAGILEPEFLQGNYVSKIEVIEGVIHITLGNHAGLYLTGLVFTLRPEVVADYPSRIRWSCSEQPEIPGKNLPASCK